MTLASRALALGADFTLLGPERTMLRASVPVVAVSAVRTGCGKSPIARWLAARLRASGRRRGGRAPPDAVQRPRAAAGAALRHAGRSRRRRLHRRGARGVRAAPGRRQRGVRRRGLRARSSPQAAAAADVLVWDGGNNDFPFVRPDLHIVVADALRPDDAAGYYPGEAVLRMADVVVVSKVNTASSEQVARALATVARVNPRAPVVRGPSSRSVWILPISSVDGGCWSSRMGPRSRMARCHTALDSWRPPRRARRPSSIPAGAPRPSSPRSSRDIPTSDRCCQPSATARPRSKRCAATIEDSDADVVLAATPVDLARLLTVSQPIVRARYEFEDGGPTMLGGFVDRWLAGVEASQRGETATPAIPTPRPNLPYSQASSPGTEVAPPMGSTHSAANPRKESAR